MSCRWPQAPATLVPSLPCSPLPSFLGKLSCEGLGSLRRCLAVTSRLSA